MGKKVICHGIYLDSKGNSKECPRQATCYYYEPDFFELYDEKNYHTPEHRYKGKDRKCKSYKQS